MIVSSKSPITLVGGAGCRTDLLSTSLSLAPRLVAADAGADVALASGHRPEAVIGDLDSLSTGAAETLADRLHRIDEQDSTDFDKALRSIAAPLVIAVGFTGGRLDHELAAMSALIAYPNRPCIVLGPETLAFHCPPELILNMEAGSLVSLFPMRDVTVGMTGLRWTFDAVALAAGARIGTSNEAVGGEVRIRTSGAGLLVILRSSELELAAAALMRGPG